MNISFDSENILVLNKGNRPLVGYNFMLRVEGLYDLPCKSIKAFTKENEYEFIQEGGLNDYVHMRRKPVSKPFTFEVERYVGIDYIDPLPNGADLILPIFLFVSRYHDEFIPGITKRTYVFTGCTVMNKRYGELNAENSGLLTETTTVAYREFLCIDIPIDVLQDTWAPDKNNFKGTNGRATYVSGEKRKKDKEALAKKWTPVKGNIRGSNYMATVNAKELRKSAKEALAKKWTPSRTNILGIKGSATHLAGQIIPTPRSWPGTSSASHRSGQVKPAPRLWPAVKSATVQTGQKKPVPRTWPPKRSAASVQDFLKNS